MQRQMVLSIIFLSFALTAVASRPEADIRISLAGDSQANEKVCLYSNFVLEPVDDCNFAIKPGYRLESKQLEKSVVFKLIGSSRPVIVATNTFDKMGMTWLDRRQHNTEVELLPATVFEITFSTAIPISSLEVQINFKRGTTIHPLSKFSVRNVGTAKHVLKIPIPNGTSLFLCIEKGPQNERVEIELPQPKEGVRETQLPEIILKAPAGAGFSGKPAFDFQVQGWCNSASMSIKELRGKVVLIDFWGLWCSPCRTEMPKLKYLQQKYGKNGLIVIALHDASANPGELKQKITNYKELRGINFAMATDMPEPNSIGNKMGTGRTIKRYGVDKFPTTVLLDKNGNIACYNPKDLEGAIESCFSK